MKIDIFNAEEKYDILYTDPPWQQGRGGKKAARPNSTGTTVPAYTVRFAHEYLLWFYKKGNIILPDKDKRGAFSTVLRENSKRHHSQKPECAYQMLETFFPQAKKLELFARAERDGWDQWGNEL